MGTYKTKIIDNIICGKITGELNASLAKEWVEKLEEQEESTKETLHRFYDVRDINAVHLSFDDLWSIAQRRLDAYQAGDENLSAFWVSTPLNYGVARMYQALTAQDKGAEAESFKARYDAMWENSDVKLASSRF